MVSKPRSASRTTTRKYWKPYNTAILPTFWNQLNVDTLSLRLMDDATSLYMKNHLKTERIW
jgi:hypothetical protein